MAARYHINADDRLISLQFDAGADSNEVIELGEQLFDDPEFQPDWPQLVDLRDLDITPSEGISKSLKEYLENTYQPGIQARIAVIVNEAISPEDCAAAYKLACPLDNTEVFDDYAHAIRWLLRHGMTSLPPSLQHPDSGAYDADEGPEKQRA